MDSEFSIVLVQFAVLAAAGFCVAAVAGFVQGKRLAHLSEVIEPGSFRISGFLPRWAGGRVGGFPCRYRVVARGKNERGGARLEIRAVAGLDWMAIRSAAASRALASAGLLQDVEVGDPGLDREFRFVARDPDSLRRAIDAEAPRAALADLLGEPAFSSILVRADLVRVQWKPRQKGTDEDPGVVARRIRDSLALLIALGCGPGGTW